MKKVNLDVEERKEAGKGDMRKLKMSGFVPGIIYGDDSKAIPVKLDRKKLIHFLHSIGRENVLTNLKIKSDKGSSDQLVIIKDIQQDPVTDQFIHLDFQRVSLKKKMISEVHIILKGEPEGVKAGGMLDHALRSVEVECLPQDMPERIEIDISGFKIHDSLHVKDLPLSPGVRMVTGGERGILSILPPRKIEVEEITTPTLTEPEVISEKGKEEAVAGEGEQKATTASAAEPQKEKKEGHKEGHKEEDKKDKKGK